MVKAVIRLLLEEHFTPSIYDPILSEIGISLDALNSPEDEPEEFKPSRRRDPLFRETVLRAYEYQCAFSGFRASLGGTYFGCEAAHVQWHSYDGPDAISNGIALEPTVHKLFDAGAWSLTDDRLIIVSADFTGNKQTVDRIRNYHGKQLRQPLTGDALDVEFIQWHREPELGGVFKWPPLKL